MSPLLGLAVLAGMAAITEVVLKRRDRAIATRVQRATARLGGASPDVAARLPERLDALDRAVDSASDLAVDRATDLVASARLVRALNAIPQGVVICDEGGAVVFENEVGSSFSRGRHGDALVAAAVAELLGNATTGSAASRTLELYGPPRRTIAIDAYPLAGAAGPGSSGALAVVEDVTERRRLEQVRRDFVTNISHELKTPVGALALLAETLLDAEDAGDRQRLARRLLDEAHRVGNTIDDLLSLSRIEADQGSEWAPVEVDDIVAEAAGRAATAAEQRDIVIDAATAPGLSVRGDPRQLVSALFNLLDNAVKYSETGSSVRVSAVRVGNWVELSVSDHGVGIPQRDLDRIFERFYRVDRARSRDSGGTGLGLAIVRHVATNHGGVVSVDSREGEGSTFTLRLPALPVPVRTPVGPLAGAEAQIERSGV